MAANDIYNIPTMHSNMNYPNVGTTDACYVPPPPMHPAPTYSYPPSAPMHPMPSPSYPASAPPPPYGITPPSIYPTAPVVFTQVQTPYQTVIIPVNAIPPQTVHINDYMIWSIINLFLGGLFLGVIAVLLSNQTKKRKMEGNVAGARTMSKITLILNILITIAFFATTALLIIYYVVTLSSITGSSY